MLIQSVINVFQIQYKNPILITAVGWHGGDEPLVPGFQDRGSTVELLPPSKCTCTTAARMRSLSRVLPHMGRSFFTVRAVRWCPVVCADPLGNFIFHLR